MDKWGDPTFISDASAGLPESIEVTVVLADSADAPDPIFFDQRVQKVAIENITCWDKFSSELASNQMEMPLPNKE